MAKIEKASLDDVASIMDLFAACTKELQIAKIDQWDGSYPTATIFQRDIKAGEVFIIKDNQKLLATITLNGQQDEQYRLIDWKFRSKEVLVIHRLAVNPETQGLGFGKKLCQFAEVFGLENGFEVIRLDAYSGNPVSCRMYEKLNYHKANGLCWFHGNKLPFYCFEKKLV